MRKRRHKKPPEGLFTTTISKLSHDGRGIANIDGKTIFIRNALPDETVEFRYTSTQSSFDEGIAQTIQSPSTDRTTPRCDYFNVCGGCSLQHMSHEAQINLKQQTLLDHLQHFGAMQPETILTPLTASIWGYRHKARLGARHIQKKGDVLVGFREIYGRFVTDMQHCEVLHPSVGKKIHLLRQLLTTLSIPRDIPQIEVAIGDEKTILIIRHMQPLTTDDLDKLSAFENEHQLDIYLQPKKLNSIHKLNTENTVEFLKYALPEHELEMRFHPADFTQVNPEINRKMINQAIELLDLQPTDTVLDLFCGLGNFTLPIAKRCKQVIGVEGSTTMVERATMNAAHNDIHNTEFYACDLSQDFMSEAFAKKQFDKILIDPPRSGALEVVKNMAKFNANTILYVSCNPATLARDAKELVHEHGYTLEKAGIMDMFPHTSHVESIALFHKKNKTKAG